MDIIDWYDRVTGEDSINLVSKRAGINQSTLNRQYSADRLEPPLVVAIARAYGADVIEALIIQGLLDRDDVRADRLPEVMQSLERQEVINSLTDLELADIVWQRLVDAEEEHEPLTRPLMEPSDEQLAQNRAAFAARDVISLEGEMDRVRREREAGPDFSRMAAQMISDPIDEDNLYT